MTIKFTDQMWERFNEMGKKLPPFSEEFERHMTRKLMQMPAEIPWLFEAYRFDLKKKIKFAEEMEEMLPNVAMNDELKHVFGFILFLKKRDLEEKIEQWDHIEAIVLNQIEFRKDICRIIKVLEKSGKNKKSVVELQKKMRDTENELQEFKKTKPYIKFTKRFFDERKGHTEDD